MYPATSQYASANGDYNVDVLERALGYAAYRVSRHGSDFALTTSVGFIYNVHYHWIAVRRIGNQWVRFDGLSSRPELVSESDVTHLVDMHGEYFVCIKLNNKPN